MAAKPRFDGEWVKVSEVFNLQMGKTPSRKNPSYWNNGDHDWVSIKDLGSYGRYVGHTKETISELGRMESGIKPVPAGTLLMSFKLSLGKMAITTKQTYTNEAIMAFLDKGCYQFDLGYMWHQFRSKDWTEGTNIAVMGKTLNKQTLGKAMIRLPELREQENISTLLDKAQEQLAIAETMQVKLDTLVKSRFVEMFGENSKWEHAPLGEHVDILVGFPFKSSGYVDEGVNICGGLIIGQGKIDWGACKHWPSIAGYEKYLLSSDDIVIALDRPWVKDGFKIAQVDESHLPALLIQRTARIKAIDFNQSFVRHLLEQPEFKEHCTVKGTMVPHISNKDIASYEVPVVPKQLQQEFASFVAEVDKSRFIVQKQIEKLQTLYDSLAQEYFS